MRELNHSKGVITTFNTEEDSMQTKNDVFNTIFTSTVKSEGSTVSKTNGYCCTHVGVVFSLCVRVLSTVLALESGGF